MARSQYRCDMAPLVTATVTLDGWPPPAIELHALLAALNESRPHVGGPPATAFQHLNEITLTFPVQPSDAGPPDNHLRQIVHEAMGRVYDGPIHVNVSLNEVRRAASQVEEPAAEQAPALDLRQLAPRGQSSDTPDGHDDRTPDPSSRACAVSGCAAPTDDQAVSLVSLHTIGGLCLTVPLCAAHAQSLRQAVKPVDLTADH